MGALEDGLLKPDGWAGAAKLKVGALFAKNGGGSTKSGFRRLLNLWCISKLEATFSWLSLCWRSYSSGKGLKMLGGGGGGLRPLGPKLDPESDAGGPGGNKLPLSLLLLSLSLLLLSLLSRNLSSLFCISNSLPGWLGNNFMKSLSVYFLLKSISRSKEPTMWFSAWKVDMYSKTNSIGFYLCIIFFTYGV